jgi:hypothetical protein
MKLTETIGHKNEICKKEKISAKETVLVKCFPKIKSPTMNKKTDLNHKINLENCLKKLKLKTNFSVRKKSKNNLPQGISREKNEIKLSSTYLS